MTPEELEKQIDLSGIEDILEETPTGEPIPAPPGPTIINHPLEPGN